MKYCPCSLTIDLINELSCQLSLTADRDNTYVLKRFEHEGFSFLTITLPTFGADFEAALEAGSLQSSSFKAFGHCRNSYLPKFLSGFTKKVFDSDGVLMHDASPDAVFAIRQICYLWKKANVSCSDTRVKDAFKQYRCTDEALMSYDAICYNPEELVLQIAKELTDELFTDYHPKLINCRHGPGATAEKATRNSRLTFKQWPIRSEPFFPSSWHAIPNVGYLSHLSKIELLSSKDEPPVRVVSVPKTLKTPRIIAVEPSFMQFMQQGMLNYIVPRIERSSLTRSSIRFSDQSYNREGARRSSIHKHFATLDMSEASDRVHNALVMNVFGDSLFGKAIQSCRSRTAILPDGTSFQLRKYASMGSATCFPIEALVFYVLIQAAVHKQTGTVPTRQSIRRYSKSIAVYGDDIIVPVAWLSTVIETLEDYGLKVNQNKTFSNSQFRESCGGDYFKGVAVKPVYIRINPSDLNGPTSVSFLMSLSSTSNQFYDQGLWSFSRKLREIVQSKCRDRVPLRRYEAAGVYFKSVLFDTYARYNSKLCRFESRTVVPVTIQRPDVIKSDVGALFRGLGNVGNVVAADFESSARPYALRLKHRWIA